LGQAKNEFEKGMSTVKDASETITNAATISEMNVPRTSE
jgi:hypothetical protein